MTAFSYDADKAQFTYTVGGDTFTTALDATALYKMNVKVIYKTVNGKTTVFGIFAEKSAVIITSAYKNVTDGENNGEIKVGGTVYKTDVAAKNLSGKYYAFKSGTAAAPGLEEMVTFIDKDGNGKIDYATYVPVAVEEVTYAGVKSFTLSATGNKLFTDKTVSVYDGIAKGDKVMVVAAANSAKGLIEISKLDVISGKVTATKGSEVQVNGTWYNVNGNTMTLGTSYDFVAINDVVMNTTATTSSTKVEDYVVLVNKQALGGFQLYNQAQILRSSGEFEVVDLEADADNGSGVDFSSLALATLYTISDADGDGKYVLTAIATSAGGDGKVGGFDGYTTGRLCQG